MELPEKQIHRNRKHISGGGANRHKGLTEVGGNVQKLDCSDGFTTS